MARKGALGLRRLSWKGGARLLKKAVALLLATAALGLLFLGRGAERTEVRNTPNPPVEFSGGPARHYLQETADGQSLMQALTAARFALQWQEYAPGASKSSGGYLGMSHDQDLKAWFAEDGVTVRPTVSKGEQAQAWQLAFRLRAYGYGDELVAGPPIVSRQVKENRIEYKRRAQKFAMANPSFGGSELGGQISEQPSLIEWYENGPEGIEQGFTLNEPPQRRNYVLNEELRLVMAVEGDLHAIVKQDGQAIELANKEGKRTISYSKLVAFDARGEQLAARMEANVNGREISLVVDDADALYPIVIDPFIASLEQKLRSNVPQADARFGIAVAIDGNRAVVGAWREDSGAIADVGAAYVFSRSGSAWSLVTSRRGTAANDGCGSSVAISGTKIVYGCPGAEPIGGRAFLLDLSNSQVKELMPDGFSQDQGNRFGTSVTVEGNMAVVGAPLYKIGSKDWGAIFVFDANSGAYRYGLGSVGEGSQLGTSVALKGNVLIAGAPGKDLVASGATLVDGGVAVVYLLTPSQFDVEAQQLTASDAGAGDSFGNSVALSGNTAVVGAFGDDDKGTDAGAAYVFVRDTSGAWNEQQKLTAGDGNASNYFSVSAVAIQDNTILVGAYAWDGGTPPFILIDDDRGAAYVFTRSGTVWTQQTEIIASDGERGDSFGIGVAISGDSALIGARHATAGGTVAAGAAYVYRLPHSLGNISTRLRVETDDNILIGGFIITGSQPKKIIVRAIGPSLPFADKLADPILELRDSSGSLLEGNDNWVESPNKQAIMDSTIPPTNDLESAIVRSLVPGSYTAIVRGVNSGTGIGVVEVYDLNTAANSTLANISTRGLVQGGDNVLIAGTIVVGGGPQKVIIRALGPSVPVPGRLGDPTLELRDGNGALLEANDNWKDSPNKQAIIDSTVAPTNDLESAIVRTLTLAPHTAIVRGIGGTPGIAVVEIYALN
jgi:hypothetical protein